MDLLIPTVVFVVVVVFIVYSKLKPVFETKPVSGGHHPEILLPFSKSVELYHNAQSSASQKVRTCLAEAGIDYKSHEVNLPSTGSFDTKLPSFLRINPAGTVPVLIHEGHPVYESHEQIHFIDRVLRNDLRPSLRPTDSEQLDLMDKWVKRCSMIHSEIEAEPAFQSRVGNLMPAMTLPVFAANAVYLMNLKNLFLSAMMFPLLKQKLFPILILGFKLFGVYFFKLPRISNFSKRATHSLTHHLLDLENDLARGGGPWICGETFSLADVSWVPVFERMEVARLWALFVEGDNAHEFRRVAEYWNRIKGRPCYIEGRVKNADARIEIVKKIIDYWKVEHPWLSKTLYGDIHVSVCKGKNGQYCPQTI